MDAREGSRRIALAELRFIERHRVGMYALTIAVSAGAFVFIWRTLSLTVAIVLIGLCLVYGVALSVVAVVRVRRFLRRT